MRSCLWTLPPLISQMSGWALLHVCRLLATATASRSHGLLLDDRGAPSGGAFGGVVQNERFRAQFQNV